MRSIIAILLTAIAAAPALAEQVNFTVTPSPGQRVTQIRIEPICATCDPPVAPAPVVEAPEPKPAPKPRKRAAKKPSCDCAGPTAERDACNTNLATAIAERDAARADLAECEVAKGACEKTKAELAGKVADLEVRIKALEEAAKATKPAPPPAAPPQGRGSSRGRRGAAPAAVAPAAAPPPAAPPQGQEEDFSPIQIRGKLTTQ